MIIKYRVDTLSGAFGWLELIPTKGALMPSFCSFASCKPFDADPHPNYFQFIQFINKEGVKKANLIKCFTNDPTFLSERVCLKTIEDTENNFGKPGNYLFEYLRGSSAIAGHGNYVHEFKGFEIQLGDKIIIKNGHSYVFILDTMPY